MQTSITQHFAVGAFDKKLQVYDFIYFYINRRNIVKQKNKILYLSKRLYSL